MTRDDLNLREILTFQYYWEDLRTNIQVVKSIDCLSVNS